MIVRILHSALCVASRAILKRYQPTVIAVTGSVGKTSTKDAITLVMASRFSTRANEKNNNNEIGVPCTVIGFAAPGRSLTMWIALAIKAAGLLLWKHDYPKFLVLEFGADAPGDIAHLCQCAAPDTAVIIALERVHEGKFGSFEAIVKEKLSLLHALKPGGVAVLNADNERLAQSAGVLGERAMTYGVTNAAAHVRAMDVRLEDHGGSIALCATVQVKHEQLPLTVNGLVNVRHIGALLAAITVGMHNGISLADCITALSHYAPPPGRGRLIAGIRGSLIIDDTYNASPASCKAALDFFKNDISGITRRIAVFGDMLELGDYSQRGHEEVGEHFVSAGGDILVTVGPLAKGIADGARKAGLSADATHSFDRQEDAIRYLGALLTSGDRVILKGSQGARMERIVKAIMQHPQQESHMLVRQELFWRKRP